MRKGFMIAGTIFVLSAGVFLRYMYIGRPDSIKQPSVGESPISQNDGYEKKNSRRKAIKVENVDFQRLSDREIKIMWPGRDTPYVERYIIKRKRDGEDGWQTLGTQVPDGTAPRRGASFVDTLEDSTPQQYEYRIDVEVKDETEYRAVEGRPVLASNILICIDPGHYGGQNVVNEDGTAYAEGDFTLELAKELKEILEGTYGITSYLTRETGTVTLGGYTDGDLDSGHISLRGEYAKGSDLFLSLHTNANLENANGYGTNEQPIGITKPIVIANTIAWDSELALAVGNGVGDCLAEANARLGIAVPGKFREVGGRQDMVPWTDALNDGIEDPGTVCYRLGEYGDYYGVLRGAANVGVPGMIIEHGFHTVPEMRQLAAQGELKTQWAQADAKGIAGGIRSVLQKLWE